MTYNDRELGKWKEGWDLWESCLVAVLIPPSSAQRDPDLRFTLSWKGEGNVSQGTECWSRCQKLELFSPPCRGPAYLLQAKPFSVSPLRKQR